MDGYNGCQVVCEPEEVACADATHAAGSDPAGVIRIWLVDDSDNYRVLLASLLNDERGLNVSRHFYSPEGVLKALARERAPNVILLDIQMGPDSGLDAIQPIKALAPATHVLMLTTLADRESRERAFRCGASDFMLKSWDLTKIVAHIRRAMELGPAAGLVTAFLERVKPVAPVVQGDENAKSRGKTNAIERGLVYLRDLFKLESSS